ncbi:TRAP transporter large permease subunit [Limnohabitans sp. Rim8]|uniref:TRAP transporter large permease n=1 Tax=Limnohabitans sp. Rim8 TaxID=1100718 RepID=UPI002616C4C3|nr:TRAP transporter large permease subunit [Limnohabitans sp. Rim8]
MLLGIDIAVWSILILVAMVGLLVIGVPLAFTTGGIGVALCLLLFGPQGLFLLASRTFTFFDTYVLVAVPFFIFMASIFEKSGLASDLYNAVKLWTGRLPGGAAIVTTVFGIIIGAIIGVAGGEIVLMGLVAMPQLLRLGYDRKITIGLVCATGALGSMIPPSIILVFYGLSANVSIGDLFLASFLPGLLLAVLFVAYVLIRCIVNPSLGPPPPLAETQLPFAAKLKLITGVALPMLVLLATLGSIYLGIASVTESAAVGTVGTIVAVWIRRELTATLIRDAMVQTMSACGMVLWLVIGTNALIGVYNLMGGIEFAKELLTNLPFPPFIVLSMMLLVWIFLGFFIDWIGILLLTMPVFLPVILAFGYDPLWFGVLFNMAMQVAYLTPPFAPAAFYLKGVAPPGMTLEEIFSAMWPFIGLQLLGLAIVTALPQIALWLPALI